MKIKINKEQKDLLNNEIFPKINLQLDIPINKEFEIKGEIAEVIRDECMELEVRAGIDEDGILNDKGIIAVQLIDIFYC